MRLLWIVPVEVDIFMVHGRICSTFGFTLLEHLVVFRVHASEHARSRRPIVVNTAVCRTILTVDLVHQILIRVAVLLQVLLLALHLKDLFCDAGKSLLAVALDRLNDFIRIRR